MPIDPSIPLQSRVPSLADVYLQAQQIKGMQAQQANQMTLGQIYGQQLKADQLRFGQMQRDADEAQTVDSTLSKYYKPGQNGAPGDIDYGAAASALAASGHGRAAVGLQNEAAAVAAAKKRVELETQKTQLDVGLSHLNMMDRMFQNVNDQASLDRAIRSGLHNGILRPEDVGPGKEVNPVYVPEEIADWHARTLTAKDVAEQKYKQLELDIQKNKNESDARHNAFMEMIGLRNANLRAGELDNSRNPKTMAFVPQDDGSVKSVLVRPGMTLPKGTGTLAGMGAAGKAADKETKAYQSIVDEADTAHQMAQEASSGNPEADVDLALAFFKTMKGSGTGSGIRFTQQEQNLIMGARNSAGDLQAVAQKVIGGGQKFTPQQRQNILRVIDIHADAARKHLGSSGGSEASPNTHQFSVSAWQRANPGGNAAAAQAEAQRQGYQVVQ